MKTLKDWILFFVVSLVSTIAVGCSDDDDPKDENGTYYIEVSDIKGGGLSGNEIEAIKTELNAQLKGETIEGNMVTVERLFLESMNKLESQLKAKFPVLKENMQVVLVLKNKDGVKIADSTIFLMKPVVSQ